MDGPWINSSLIVAPHERNGRPCPIAVTGGRIEGGCRAGCECAGRVIAAVAHRLGLFDAEKVTTVFVDHFQRAAATSGYTRQRIFRNDDRQAGLFHEQAIQIA